MFCDILKLEQQAFKCSVTSAFLLFQIEVTAVIKDYETYQWQVFYRSLGENSTREEKSVRANIVIISAGCIGSTKILMESSERGLEVSSEVGKSFFTNGGIFGMFFSILYYC